MEQSASLGDKGETVVTHYSKEPQEVVQRGGHVICVDCSIGADQSVVWLCRESLETFSRPQAREANLLAPSSNQVHMPSSVTKGCQPAKEEDSLRVVDRPW